MIKNTLLTLSLLTASSLIAQTTICYKESLNSPSQSEIIKLDGGLCAGKKSAKDMQKDGWITEDIKLTSSKKGLNYTFIFTKNTKTISATASPLSEEELTQKIVEKLTKQEEIKKQKTVEKIQKDSIVRIKDKYINQCQLCHGKFGELNARGTSKPLNTLSADDMKHSIKLIKLNLQDNGNAFVMRPYTNMVNDEDLEAIYNYLKSIQGK